MSDRKSTTMSTGKAFSNPSAAKVEQQRKILEALERQKKLIKTSTTGSSSTAYDQSSLSNTVPVAASEPTNSISSLHSAPSLVGAMSTAPTTTNTLALQDSSQGTQQMNSNQRKALEEANKTSFGYFITQDSSFGNLILPVIPRIPPPANTANASSSTINTN